MGAALRVLNLPGICDSCSRYVCNACHFHSQCSECCSIEMETEKVDLPDGEDEELVVDGCCAYRHND